MIHPTERLKILVVEDNEIARRFVFRTLHRQGYDIHAVSSGQAALDYLKNEQIDFVLMDLQMPGLDGIETTRRIREMLPQDKQPVIVALTANAFSGDRDICMANGMNGILHLLVIEESERVGFLVKPIEADSLLHVVRTYESLLTNT